MGKEIEFESTTVGTTIKMRQGSRDGRIEVTITYGAGGQTATFYLTDAGAGLRIQSLPGITAAPAGDCIKVYCTHPKKLVK